MVQNLLTERIDALNKVQEELDSYEVGGKFPFKQFFEDNPLASKHHKHAKEAAVILKADYFGPYDELDVNKDIENGNIDDV